MRRDRSESWLGVGPARPHTHGKGPVLCLESSGGPRLYQGTDTTELELSPAASCQGGWARKREAKRPQAVVRVRKASSLRGCREAQGLSGLMGDGGEGEGGMGAGEQLGVSHGDGVQGLTV